MKLTIFILFVGCLQVSAREYAQDKITLSEKNAKLEKILEKIQQQSGYTIWYEKKLLTEARSVSIQVVNASLEEVLAICFRNQPLTYEIVNRIIVVKKRDNPLPVDDPVKTPAADPGTTIEVRGLVTDPEGKPLQGVSITVKGTKRGVQTDANGVFVLSAVEANAELLISSVGYESKDLLLHNRNQLSIVLARSLNNLDETVVKGYYNTTQRLNTGDVTTIHSDVIEKQPVENVLAAIEGRVTGLFIQQQTGVPGGGYTVQIRGQNSINNGNLPLYVIDGVPYNTPGTLLGSFNNAAGGGDPLNYISPSEIESVSVLKDADATAIYGSRGANGVILITTKKGKGGKTQFNLNVFQGYGNQAFPLKLMNREQYLQVRRTAYANDGRIPYPSNAYDVNGVWDSTRTTNWPKLLTGNTAVSTNLDASVSGGNEAVQYLLAGQFNKAGTVFPGDFSDQKVNLHFNLAGASPDKKWKTQFSGFYLSDINHLPSTDLSGSQYYAPDAPPLYQSDGSLNWAQSTWTNPLSNILQPYHILTNNLVSNGVFSYELLRGLELKANLGFTNMQVNEVSETPIASNDPAYASSLTGSAFYHYQNFMTWNVEPQASYQANGGPGKLSVLFGTSFMNYQNNGHAILANGYTSDQLLESLNGASSFTVFTMASSLYRYNSAYARLNYNLQEKYLLNLVARRDGSSRFGPGKQFADFGALGAAWIFSGENFVKKVFPALSFGKLRASYGTSGNDQIGDYTYLDLYNPVSQPYASVTGLLPTAVFNSNFAWEVNKKLEAGLELGFLKDRISVNANYFLNRSSNQLLDYPLPTITGINFVLENLPALVQNAGIEGSLHTVNIKTSHFTWISSFNISFDRNKLIRYPGLSTSGNAYRYVIGQPLNIRRVFHSLGVNDTSGIYQFTDYKGQPTYNPTYNTDNTTTVNLNPKYFGGLDNSFTYKGFELDIFLQFVNQLSYNPLFQKDAPGRTIYNNLPATYFGHYWQQPGDKATYEMPTSTSASNAYNEFSFAQSSDLAYIRASYIRVKNIALSYTFPPGILGKLHGNSLRLYVQGQNLFTFTGLKADPEVQYLTTISPIRVLTTGLQFSF